MTGTGSGVGRATALAFAREGANVLVADVRYDRAVETVELITERGGAALPYKVDVADAGQVNALLDSAVASFGKRDVFFSNAAVIDKGTPCGEIHDELWAKVLGVNVSGTFYGIRAALPHLARAKGSVVITASVASLGGMVGEAAYTVSKYAVAGFVNQIACEVATEGVRVNAVAPGGVRTNIFEDMRELRRRRNWSGPLPLWVGSRNPKKLRSRSSFWIRRRQVSSPAHASHRRWLALQIDKGPPGYSPGLEPAEG